jgi:homoserine kinase type II
MATHPLGRAHATRLAPHLEAIRKLRRPLPRGVVHGDLFVDNTKWRRGDLIAAFDWEMAGRDHLMLDLGVCLNAWCWMRDGGSGGFVEDRCRALVDGYQSVRPLSQTERRGLFVETLFAALRFTMSRIRDFELDPARGGERVYLDYRDFEARLETWRALGARAFQRTVLA